MAASERSGAVEDENVSSRSAWRVSARRYMARYAAMDAVGTAAGGLLPWVGEWWFPLELGSHFQHAYLLIALVSMTVLLLLRRWYLALVAGIAVALTGAHVVPCYLGASEATVSGAPLRMMTVNVLTVNRRAGDLEALIAEEQPDIVALQELDDAWVRALEDMADAYPHQMFDPRSDNFGIGIMSRIPLESAEFVDFFGVNAIRADVVVGSERVTILNVHTLPPASPSYAAIRNRQLERAAGIVESIEGPAIVLGDLNVTMWSPIFRGLLTQTKLRDARKGHGIVSTWPVGRLPFMIPIDHCLYRPPLQVKGFWRGSGFGSDHLPLVIDFVVPQADREETANAAA